MIKKLEAAFVKDAEIGNAITDISVAYDQLDNVMQAMNGALILMELEFEPEHDAMVRPCVEGMLKVVLNALIDASDNLVKAETKLLNVADGGL